MEAQILKSRRVDEPLYKWVKRGLVEQIGLGTWRPAQAIPPERKLAECFDVSMGTLRRAIDELVDENVLVRHQGRGTFVTAHDRSRYLFRFFHLCGHDGKRGYPEITLQHFETARADAVSAREFGIGAGARVFRIRNFLTLNGEPAVLDDIMLPAARFPGMDRECVETRPGTLYQLYEERFGVSVVRIDERIRAVSADAGQALALQVPEGTPLLLILRRAYSVDGGVVERRRSHVLSRSIEYAKSGGDRELS